MVAVQHVLYSSDLNMDLLDFAIIISNVNVAQMTIYSLKELIDFLKSSLYLRRVLCSPGKQTESSYFPLLNCRKILGRPIHPKCFYQNVFFSL